MPRPLFSMACIAGGMVFASAVNFFGSGLVVQKPETNPSTDDEGGRFTVLTQAMGGLSGSGYPGSSQPKGDIIPNAWKKNEQDTPTWLQEVNEDSLSREAALREALRKRVHVRFKSAPLSEVVEYVAKELKVEIVIDARGLDEEALTPEEPISIDRTDARVKDILSQILEPLNLTTRIKDEVIYITNKKNLANITRCYDLSFILPDNTLVLELLNAIEATVTPDLWLNAGGTATMYLVGSTVVVNAPENSHDEIAEVLRGVAKQDNANKRPLKREKLPDVQPTSAGKSSQGNPSSESGK